MNRVTALIAASLLTMFLLVGTAMAAQPVVVMETSHGMIMIALNEEKAPVTVKNFLSYVDKGFYDGTVFHRVIPNFMIQGGGFNEDMREKPTMAPIKNEAANGLINERGSVAMARTAVVDSATAQFFINVKDNPFLDHRKLDPSDPRVKGMPESRIKMLQERQFGYAVFGKVIRGMDVVDKIKKVKTATKGMHQDVPVEPVLIKKAYRYKEPK
jgi:cyclophilin family peptidyl-prolyl cis-trans isomerase